MKTFTSVFACSIFLLLFSYHSNVVAQGGNALDFDGLDDEIAIPVIPSDFVTIEFYINYVHPLNGNGTSALPFNFATAGDWIALNNRTGDLTNETIAIRNGTEYTATDTDITAGWHLISIVSDGVKYTQIYIDGVAANMIAADAPIYSNTKIDVGLRDLPPFQAPFEGMMDEFRIWGDIRTPMEIMTAKNTELTGTETDLIAYFNFNSGTASGNNAGVTTLTDNAGTYSGLLSGFSLSGAASNWILSTAPLPVEFLSFKAVNILDGISLNWETTQEINNSGFEVQYSRDVEQWENLGFVDGKGSFDGVNSYEFLHTQPLKGINYYRLKQIDINGAVDYSDIVSLYSAGLGAFNVYPNPSSDMLTIEGIDIEASRYRIMDNSGRIVQQAELNSNQIDISSLARGMYLISIQTLDKNIVERIVKN